MELTSSDILGLMVAARTDEATTERLQQLHEMLAKLEAAKAENEKFSMEASATLAQASKHRNESDHMRAAAEAKERVLDEREHNMGVVQAQIQDEKAAWERVRQQVDAEQKAKIAELEASVKELNRRVMAVEDREEAVKAREEAAAALHISATSKIAALHDALNTP